MVQEVSAAARCKDEITRMLTSSGYPLRAPGTI